LPRRIRALKKGFARIVFHFIDKHPDADVMIVPVGLNYNNVFVSGGSVNILIGKAFSSKEYYLHDDQSLGIEQLKTKVSGELKKLVTHIDDLEQHDTIVEKLKTKGVNFLTPININSNEIVVNQLDRKLEVAQSNRIIATIYKVLFSINTVFPLIIWQLLKYKVNRIELFSTFKFGFSLVAIPLFYLIQGVLIAHFFDYRWMLLYWGASVLLLYLYKNAKGIE